MGIGQLRRIQPFELIHSTPMNDLAMQGPWPGSFSEYNPGQLDFGR